MVNHRPFVIHESYNLSHANLVLTIRAFRIFSQAFTEAGAISSITLGEAFKCVGITAILTGRIEIRNPEFNFS